MVRAHFRNDQGNGSHPGRISRASCALLAALALAACATTPLPPLTPSLPDVAAAVTPRVETDLRTLIEAGPVVVAGERLNAGLLKAFYARHGFEPFWASRQRQADALVEAVLRAGDHGLSPDLFHATLLKTEAALSPLDREVLLSDAFLTYADALARGAFPVERRRGSEILAPEPVDVPALLDQAADSAEPGAVLEALAPTTPTYRALREALQRYRTDAVPRGGSRLRADRLRTLAVNLERQRWLPRRLPSDRVWVNAADERVVLYRADQPVFSSRVVVGEDIEHNQSPEFRATINAGFYNPPWVIPADIAAAEVLPKLIDDPDYLSRNGMVLQANGEVEQLPGPEAGLGLVMFDMPNRFDVYLHDTPERDVFARVNRRISHGCIRVENPLALAALLMDQPLGTIDEQVATGSTTRNALPTPMPVFVVYQTAFLGADGAVQFRPDFYRRDAAIWRSLQKQPS